MALETCTIASSLHAHHLHYSSKEKLKLQSKSPFSTLSTPLPSPPLLSFHLPKRSNSKPRFICQAKNAVDAVVAVTDESWNNLVIGNETPVLVEFWAPWCGPCRMIAPVIDELAKEYAGKLACCKVNTDDCPNIASKYGIRSIPTVLVFKNGERKECIVGAVPKSTLCTTIDKYVEG
ncbi:Protein-disulfide reductase protein [Dioscorea alata]|uniref:Protein-disulfide reductase protein n=1 Tax=Dioscorea alata TaxID=55571 RepID=A0ACB7USP2_DIOAL|nr:Protein-disulfide reductase protein [Dioscorea alata]